MMCFENPPNPLWERGEWKDFSFQHLRPHVPSLKASRNQNQTELFRLRPQALPGKGLVGAPPRLPAGEYAGSDFSTHFQCALPYKGLPGGPARRVACWPGFRLIDNRWPLCQKQVMCPLLAGIRAAGGVHQEQVEKCISGGYNEASVRLLGEN